MAVRNKNKTGSKQFNFDFSMNEKGKKLFRLTGLLLLSVSLIYSATRGMEVWSKAWPVKSIEVQGEKLFVTQSSIEKFMLHQPERGLLAIDLQELQREAKKIDWIKDVDIRKVWPNKLIFTINEHIPVALFNENDSDKLVLTQQGSLIKNISNDENSQFKALSQLPIIDINIGTPLEINQALNVWQKFKQMKREFELLEFSLSYLKIDQANNWQLFFSQGLELNLGKNLRLERANRLVKVYQVIENKSQIKKIDLRYHNGFAIEWSESEKDNLDKNELNKQELKRKG